MEKCGGGVGVLMYDLNRWNNQLPSSEEQCINHNLEVIDDVNCVASIHIVFPFELEYSFSQSFSMSK